MMNYQMTLNELVTATGQARENYRRRGALISRMLYEFWYVLLGTEAFDQQSLTLRCPFSNHTPYPVVLDACVQYPSFLRDLLIRLGLTGLYQPKWSASIENEWQRNLLLNRTDPN